MMINYILGILIGLVTIFIIYSQIKKVKSGKISCCGTCSGCTFKTECESNSIKK